MIIDPYIFGVNLLLDYYPCNGAAFSFYKLSKNYNGGCCTVMRSSDNTYIDVGFVNNYVDTAYILSFVGSGNGYVAQMYDQTGNNRKAIGASSIGGTAYNPIIVQSGVLCTDSNGKVVARNPTASSGRWFNLAPALGGVAFSTLQNLPVSIFTTAKITTLPTNIYNNAAHIVGGTAFGRYEQALNDVDGFGCQRRTTTGADVLIDKTPVIYTPFIQTGLYRSSQLTGRFNGVDATPISYTGTAFNTASNFQLMTGNSATMINPAMDFYECIIYLSDEYSNRAAIESDINSRYSIF